MPLETNFNVSPYHDDHDPNKDFQKVLFKPSVSVQVRELNQLQTLLQQQIERFGDSVYRQGTIVDGCNFSFHESYPYVKIRDVDTLGAPAVPSNYVGLFAHNANGLTGFVVDYEDGYETTDPNLKTLYVNYVNSGNTYDLTAFSPGDVLTLTDSNVSIFSVTIDAAGLGFSNNESIVVTPRLIVNVSTGSFTNAEYVTQPTTGANLQIIDIDDETLSLDGQVILTLRPRTADLANGLVNSAAWSVANNDTIRNTGNTAVGAVEGVIGTGATGHVLTDGSGRVTQVVMTAQGIGYTNTPHVTVRSPNNSTGIGSLTLTPKNYYAKVTASENSDAIGNGYAFSVSTGVIYQKGYFLRVEPQTVIVSRYSQTPNAVSAVFDTIEEIVDYRQDSSLLDNVRGTDNAFAPGADRLSLTPRLLVVNSSAISSNGFFPLIEWSEGNPYRQNQVPSYSQLGQELATRTHDEAGDFVTDPFLVSTRSPANTAFEGNTVSVAVDPGHAYVSGYRVKTDRNYIIDVGKGLDTRVESAQKFSLGYGSWVRVKEVGGVFQFNTGDTVKLYDAAKGFLSSTTLIESSNLTAAGSQIGTARARMMVIEDGQPGEATATYRLYLFDIRMNAGKQFRQVRSVVYDGGTYPGVADVVLQLDPSTASNVAVLQDSANSQLVFEVGVDGLRNANAVTYQYRTIDQGLAVSNSGVLTKSLASSPGEYFPYNAPLTDADMRDLVLIPVGGDLRAAANITGSVTANTSTANIIGSGTAFITDLEAGDYVWVYSNATAYDVKQVRQIVNNTLIVVDSNCSFTNTSSGIQRLFPNNVPVPLGSRSGLSANVDANGNILTVNLGMSFIGSTTVNAAMAFSVDRIDVTAGTKVAARDKMVKLCLANNSGNTAGPWCLGVSDAFRLKAVYVGNSTVNTTAFTNVVDDFYIDHAQTPDYVGLAWLYKRPKSSLSLTTDDYLLPVFDAFEVSDAGFFAVPSYTPANTAQVANVDSRALANLGSSIASYEVPEIYTTSGRYYDLLTSFDFRPIAANTVTASDSAGSAPVNPASTISFGNTANPANDKKFPKPGSTLTADVEYYLGRRDSVFLSKDGKIFVLSGTPSENPVLRDLPNQPSDTIKLNDVEVPSYPTLPVHMSTTLANVVNTRVANEVYAGRRASRKTAKVLLSDAEVDLNQPARYTMRDIGGLERRIENLEYIASLNALQSDVNSRVIPSSLDPSLNRFKFGFFVNDFDTQVSSQTTDPQYAATVENGRCYPPRFEWSVTTLGQGLQSPDFCDQLIVHQPIATYPIPNTTPNTEPNTTPNCVPNTSWTYEILAKAGHLESWDQSKYYTYWDVEVGNVAAQMTFWFYNYGSPDIVEIWQGNTLLTGTRDAIDLTAADKTFLVSNSMPSEWFKDQYQPGTGPQLPPFEFVPFQVMYPGTHILEPTQRPAPHGWNVNYTGKVVWTHNPANGNTYRFKTSFGSFSTGWKNALQYPVITSTITCPPEPTPKPPSVYDGHCVVKTQLLYQPPQENPFDSGYRTIPQSYEMRVTGLKPNTKHDCYFEGQNVNSRCKPSGGSMGNSIITDRYGGCTFTFYSDVYDFTGVGTKGMELKASASRASWRVYG